MVFGVVRTGGAALAAFAVGACISAAYFFTPSTSFANPAVTIGRMFTDTFSGIDPASVPAFVAFQLVGALVAIPAIHVLYPDPAETRARVLVQHGGRRTEGDPDRR